MDTPKNIKQNTPRIHTPRFSERKKKLFANKNNEDADDDDLLKSIMPLKELTNITPTKKTVSYNVVELLMNNKQVISFLKNNVEEGNDIDASDVTPARRSERLRMRELQNKTFSQQEKDFKKTPHPVREDEQNQLQKMFINSMRLSTAENENNDEVILNETITSEDESLRMGTRRKSKFVSLSTSSSPKRKHIKIDTQSKEAAIPTKSFYSAITNSPQSCYNKKRLSLSSPIDKGGGIPSQRLKKIKTTRRSLATPGIGRGVRHKIPKEKRHSHPVDMDVLLGSIRNEKLRHLIISKRETKQKVEELHKIFRDSANPIALARPLTSLTLNADDSNNNNMLKEKTLEQSGIEFSDIEEDSDSDEVGSHNNVDMSEVVVPIIKHKMDETKENVEEHVLPNKRKFFKSGLTTNRPKHVQITDNIKATVTGMGKLCIVQEKKKKPRKRRSLESQNEFSNEQAAVDVILRNLDDSIYGEAATLRVTNKQQQQQQQQQNEVDHNNRVAYQELPLYENNYVDNEFYNLNVLNMPEYEEFYKRLPYNTNDPEIIERQHILLEFLITNNICTEDNFTIFIGDPDNHKEEAERIVNELVMIVNGKECMEEPVKETEDKFQQRLLHTTADPDMRAQQQYFLNFLNQHNICTEENYDIFITNYDQRKAEAEKIMQQFSNVPQQPQAQVDVLSKDKPAATSPMKCSFSNSAEQQTQQQQQQKLYPIFLKEAGSGVGVKPLPLHTTQRKAANLPRCWNAGYGLNQYQIDAGQKQFGATQCKQCGLLYTMHEPEEEKLHRDFHASMHVLRFKGWIDEDIVAVYPEWSADGRILRLTDTSPVKRRERLKDILKVVDKELGYASYIIPKSYAAYFAVRKMQMVGLCLVQPLEKANKYLSLNGVDCCTEEEFDVRCGISRIWVAPLHRRLHIASKLLQAVRVNTIFGQELPWDQIAFSAPTEMGKLFAQKVTRMENFMVYQ